MKNGKKVILITGASSGMGKAGALSLIREGHIVYGAARNVDQMQDIVRSGGHVLALDVTDIKSIKSAIEYIMGKEHRIDVLWNNAGYSVAGAVEDVSYEDACQQFKVNLFGLAEVTKAVLPHMREQMSGTIINTSSVGGKVFTPLGAWYHASKFALEGWSDCLRIEVAPYNINVVILQPGGIKTEFGKVMYEPLMRRAKGSAYEDFTIKVANSYAAYYSDENKALSPPSVISNLVIKILRSRTPKTRYAAGYMSRTALFLRWLLSDRLFERVILSQY